MVFTLPELVLLSLFFFSFLVQTGYTLLIHLRLARVKIEPLDEVGRAPISVIICARNEAENLQRFLPTVLEQNYPNFEVIVVNDRSWDETNDVLEDFKKKYTHLKTVQISDGEKFIAGKKFAVSMGIKASSNDWLVFTDADCEPASSFWLLGMQRPQDTQKEILLGYSPYFKQSGLLNALIRFETFFTAVNYLSFALQGMPYMGVGRNMAYHKALFFKSKGFASHMHIPSGDDDLFVNANANRGNTGIMIHPDAHVNSIPNNTWKGYLRQKKRHFGAGRLYKPKHQWILTIQIVVQFLFYASFIALCFFPATWYPAFGIMGFSLILRTLVYARLMKRLRTARLIGWFPLLDGLLFLFLTLNALLSIFVKKVYWR